MHVFKVLLSVVTIISFTNGINALICSANATLVLSHVIFRHGDRTPTKSGLWQSNSYYNESFYYPYGYGQLTNKGKMRMYELGGKLQNRYSNFLDDVWNVKLYEAWSTDYDRTKMSLQLLLGGLFPPKNPVIWNENILWQPAPYNYLPVEQDKELSSWACPTTVPLIYNDSTNMEKLKSYDQLINTLKENTGEDLDYISALYLYFGMATQEEFGLPLDNWTTAIYPEPLKSYIVDFYYIESSTQELKKVVAGYLLKKILSDTMNKINGNLNPPERKIFLYSGHEVNVGTFLAALELYTMEDPPPYGSYVMLEVYEKNGTHGIKMYYEDYTASEPHLLTLPGCQSFCPLDDFVKLTSNIIPASDIECYGE